MQIDGIRWYQVATRATLAALLLALSALASAQQAASPAGQTIPDDYYRAEFVILKRIVSPEAVNEKMADREVEPTPETGEVLWAVGEDGTARTTLKLAPRNELHLASAAERLERSGRYRVLATAGWYEAFPPDYQGEALRVEVGDWLEEANTRAVEGTITIDRQRYLHVNVHLNHWQLAETTDSALPEADPAESTVAMESSATEDAAEDPGQSANPAANPTMSAFAEPAPLELVTWIRETRRMRSEEVHFLDSPTLGVLIFFKKVEKAE
ncbi:CsiV family protein [Marinobacter sp.]|uniref:CsiV family protein n=1 Tax=Marinobacter sp. TaxID=50741 RepID=UPI0035C6EF55